MNGGAPEPTPATGNDEYGLLPALAAVAVATVAVAVAVSGG